MEEIQGKKKYIREEMAQMLSALAPDEMEAKQRELEERLFDFANFLEARIVLLYLDQGCEVPTEKIIRESLKYGKIVVLPVFNSGNHRIQLYKVDDFDKELKSGARGVPEPDPAKCKKVPIDKVDIAIIPGYAYDEKGGRIGSGLGYYDRFIPKLAITTRKVALTFDDQVIAQVPMESHDKFVDIIITDKRIIYKI